MVVCREHKLVRDKLGFAGRYNLICNSAGFTSALWLFYCQNISPKPRRGCADHNRLYIHLTIKAFGVLFERP